MFEEAFKSNNQNQHQFSVTRKDGSYFLKKTKDFQPDQESHIFSGSYKEARKLWHRLSRKNNGDRPIA